MQNATSVKDFSPCQLAPNEWLAVPGTESFVGLSSESDTVGVEIGVSADADSLLVSQPLLSTVIKPRAEKHSKPLKQWLKQWDTPPWLRSQVLLFEDLRQPVAIVVNQPSDTAGDGRAKAVVSAVQTRIAMTILAWRRQGVAAVSGRLIRILAVFLGYV